MKVITFTYYTTHQSTNQCYQHSPKTHFFIGKTSLTLWEWVPNEG